MLAALHEYWMPVTLLSVKPVSASTSCLCGCILTLHTGGTALAIYHAVHLTMSCALPGGAALSQVCVCRHCAGKGGWCPREDDAGVQHLCWRTLGQRPAVVLLDSPVLWLPALHPVMSHILESVAKWPVFEPWHLMCASCPFTWREGRASALTGLFLGDRSFLEALQ